MNPAQPARIRTRLSPRRAPSGRARALISLMALALLMLLGLVDWFTGYELSFSVFYLAPVVVMTWYVGSWPGYVTCVLCALTWYAMDVLAGHPYSHPAIPVWNALVRLCFFVVVATLLLRLQSVLLQLQQLAERDALTGLFNARSFTERGERLVRLAARHGNPFALGYIDLDGFKGVNDRFGHAQGDVVLSGVSRVMSQSLRASDLTARLGGDEFAVLLPQTDAAGAAHVFRHLHASLVEAAAAQGWPVGFSVGVVTVDGTASNLQQAVKAADALMYRVKGEGKNAVRIEPLAAPTAAPTPSA